jgi:hypothetical protein
MTTEGFIGVFIDPVLHQYIIDFTLSNIIGENEQESFLKDIWCHIGRLGYDNPSNHMVMEVLWKEYIKIEPILNRLADGYKRIEVAMMDGVHRNTISKKSRKFYRKCVQK